MSNLNFLPQPALVIWEDAGELRPDGITWASIDDCKSYAQQRIIVESLGFVIENNDKYILLSGCRESQGEQYSQLFKIPKACIIAITKLMPDSEKADISNS